MSIRSSHIRKIANRAEHRRYYYIYKITRDDGAFYYGRHSTDNINDGYFGSGIRITRSVAKYGIEHHKFEIVEFLPSMNAVKTREKEIVTEEMIKDPRCLNIAPGGGGGGRAGFVPVRDSIDLSVRSVTRKEFYENRTRYIATNEGLCVAINTETGETSLIPTTELDGKKFIHPCAGKVMIQTQTGHRFVSRAEFDTGEHHGVNYGRVQGEQNPRAKYIQIFDAAGMLKFNCRGDFEEVCRKNDLPFAALRTSYTRNGEPIYQHARSLTDAKKNGRTQFIGWFATSISMKEQLAREAALDELVSSSQMLGGYD